MVLYISLHKFENLGRKRQNFKVLILALESKFEFSDNRMYKEFIQVGEWSIASIIGRG